VLSNPSMPQCFKVGTTKNLPKRIKDLSGATGVPTPFEVEFAIYVDGKFATPLEKHIHLILIKYRINKRREFFAVDSHVIRNLFNLLVISESAEWLDREEEEDP